jgi:hypothetical protein
MSEFSELCPLFTTGVYNEIYLGLLTGSMYDTATYNFLSNPGDPATCPSSFRFGRTVVVTEAWLRRKVANTTNTISVHIGRRAGSGTATVSGFGTHEFSEDATTFPDYMRAWHALGVTSFTLATADVLQIGVNGDATTGSWDVVVQYREK